MRLLRSTRTTRHHCSTNFFCWLTNSLGIIVRRLTPWVGWVTGRRQSDRIHICELGGHQHSSCGPRTHQILLPRVTHHPLHQPAIPNYDEHELHRRLRSQKASNRSFLRRHRNGREGMSHFGNAPHMHTCTQHTTHTQTQTNGNWRCWRRPDSTVSKLGYTTGRGKGGISVDQRSNVLLFGGASRDGCLWKGLDPDWKPELACS